MGDEHPEVGQMEQFLRGSLGPEETAHVVRHLLRGCSTCRESIRQARERESRSLQATDPGAYDRAFESAVSLARSREVDLAHERVVAHGLFAALEDAPVDEQERRIRAEARFQTWGFCERLIDESRDLISSGERARAVDFARLAVAAGESIDPGKHARGLVEDLQARAWAELANAHRGNTDFAAAREALAEARRRSGLGTCDRAIEARIMSLEASLLIDLGRWEEALDACDRILDFCRMWDLEDLIARTQVKKAIPLGHLDPRAAVALVAEAEGAISRGAHPRLFLCARHNRIWYLNDAGESEAALLLLEDSRPLYRQFPDDWMQLRLRWLEARISFGLGHLDEAESELSLLWSFVFERRLHLEVALVTLDLTAVYAAKGEMQKAWRTAGRLVPLFQSWGVHPEAMAAWLLLQRAFAAETATAGLIGEVGRYLQRSWKNPELSFQPARV